MTEEIIAAEDGPQAEEDRRRKRMARTLLLVIVVLVAVWILMHIRRVPDTVGMSATRSKAMINEAGFESIGTTATVPDELSGRVVIQSPESGWHLTWWPVHVVVGTGWDAGGTDAVSPSGDGQALAELPSGEGDESGEVLPYDAEEMDPLYQPNVAPTPLMPNVQNMTEAKATRILRDAGFAVYVSRGPSTTAVKQGRVFWQSPGPGGITTGISTARIWISTGYSELPSPYPSPQGP